MGPLDSQTYPMHTYPSSAYSFRKSHQTSKSSSETFRVRTSLIFGKRKNLIQVSTIILGKFLAFLWNGIHAYTRQTWNLCQ